MEAVVEYGMRTVADQQKLASQLGLVTDLVREASYAAGQAGAEVVTRTHVEQAIQARIFRANHAQAKLQEYIHRQVNAQLRHFATAMIAFRPEARLGTRPQSWEGLTSDEDV